MKKAYILILSLSLNSFCSENQIAGPSNKKAIELSEQDNDCFICSNTYDQYRKRTKLSCCNQSICIVCKEKSTDTYNHCPFCKKTLDEKLQEKLDECENIGNNAVLISAKIGSLLVALNSYKESAKGQKRSTVETLMPILRSLRLINSQINTAKEKLQEETAYNCVKDKMIETMSNNDPFLSGLQYGMNIAEIDTIVDDNVEIRTRVLKRIQKILEEQKREKILEETINEVIAKEQRKKVDVICNNCNKKFKNILELSAHKSFGCQQIKPQQKETRKSEESSQNCPYCNQL